PDRRHHRRPERPLPGGPGQRGRTGVPPGDGGRRTAPHEHTRRAATSARAEYSVGRGSPRLRCVAAEEARVSEPAIALATADLRAEHALIRGGLRLLEHAGRRLAAGRSVAEPAMKELVGQLRRLADQCHHGKEEGLLYPSMRAKGLPADSRLPALLAAHS